MERDYVGGAWEDIKLHVEDDIAIGAFKMTYSTFTGPDGQTEISYQHGSECDCAECETAQWERIERENSKQSYGVYGLNEQDDSGDMPYLAEATARREEWQKLLQVPSYVEMQAARFAVSDLSQLVAEECEKPLVVWMEDEILHTIESPFCDAVDCLCHLDEALFQEYIERPVKDGALKIWGAQALLWPER